MNIFNLKKSYLKILNNNGVAILAFFTAAIAAYVAVVFANQPLLEAHGFRQTQTALTSYWMMKEGWQLNYQTPVAGYPWSIPFEFPLFQSLVVLIARLGDLRLDPVGRLVSFSFLIACAWPAFKITRRLKLHADVAWVFCALLWSSPIYLFWGRTFMIETTAMFFAFAAIPYGIDLFISNPRWQSAMLFMVWITLGMLQKITTAATVILVMAIALSVNHLLTTGLKPPSLRKMIFVIVAFSIPIVTAGLWAHYTDIVKEQNLLGMQLTSGSLSRWNFGTLEQRFDLNVLKTIFWDRVVLKNAGGIWGLSLLSGFSFFAERRIKIIMWTCLILFFLPIYIFINLHFVHDYYQTSSAIFLIGALAISIVYLLPMSAKKNIFIPMATLFFIISNFYYFIKGYAHNLQMPMNTLQMQILDVSNVIRRYTPKDSGIIVFGADWNSEISYYSERKSFTVPRWFSRYEEVWNDPAAFIGNKEVGAVAYCVSEIEDDPNLIEILERPDIKKQPNLFRVNNCYLWLPGIKEIMLPVSNQTIKPMNFWSKYVDIDSLSDNSLSYVTCDGSIDSINGRPLPPQSIEMSGLLLVHGWNALNPLEGTVPDEVYITLTNESGELLFVESDHTPRIDVKEYFHQTSMPDPGFKATINVSDLSGNYLFGIARLTNGEVEMCDNFKLPINISSED